MGDKSNYPSLLAFLKSDLALVDLWRRRQAPSMQHPAFPCLNHDKVMLREFFAASHSEVQARQRGV